MAPLKLKVFWFDGYDWALWLCCTPLPKPPNTHTLTQQTHIHETIINSPSQLSAALPPHLYVILQKHALAYLSVMLSSSKWELASLTFTSAATEGKVLSVTNIHNSVGGEGLLRACWQLIRFEHDSVSVCTSMYFVLLQINLLKVLYVACYMY